MPPATDMIGLPPFGRLTVIRRAGSSPAGAAKWLCRCACGKRCVTLGYRLRQGKTTSCGCAQDEYRTGAKGPEFHDGVRRAIAKRVRPANVVAAELAAKQARRERRGETKAKARALRADGKTLAEIGQALGVTRQRAHAILMED